MDPTTTPKTQLSEWLEWLITTSDYKELWAAQPSYLISQAVYMLSGLLTLLHAFHKGGRWPYFWLGTVLHGIYADNFWHFVVPEYDNFWHSRTPVMLLGGRTPLHIFFLYPAFIYHAAYAVSRLNLPRYAEPFAVGLITVLIDIPYDIVAVKFVHWTWHDTDPNIFDRHYWVPWNSYYFHASFAASFYFFFHGIRSWFASGVKSWESSGFAKEWLTLGLATLLGMPGGVLLFVPNYHTLHDNFNIHSEVTFFLLFAIFAGIVFKGLTTVRERNVKKLSFWDYAILTQLVMHYCTYWALVVWGSPELEVSTGLHEPVGPCNEKMSLVSPFGQTLYKRKYFCLEDYDEKYFDFHCTRKPSLGANWYTICGTPFENRAEYITVLTAIIVAAAAVFYSIYSQPASLVKYTQPSKNKKKQH